MQNRRNNYQTQLTQRILDCADDILVSEIVFPDRLAKIPPNIRQLYARMVIQWANNRSWGLSFNLGDKHVTLGHRRGDHLATYPWLHNLTKNDAEILIRSQIEGTLLHELGHAVFDVYLLDHDGYREAAQAVLADDVPSSYRGQEPDGKDDYLKLHELVAEAFRYWCHADPKLQKALPHWHAFIDKMVQQVEQAVKRQTT